MKVSFDLRTIYKKRKICSEYFESLTAEIIRTNIYNMMWSAIAGVFLLTFLILLTPYIMKDWEVTKEYYALYLIFFLFFAFSTVMLKCRINNYRLTQFICGLMYALLFVGFMFISIVPYPDSTQVYISLYIMIIPVLFITLPRTNTVLTILMAAGYIIAAYLCKPYDVACQDIFSVVAAVLFSRVLAYTVLFIRTEDFLIRKELKKEANIDMLTLLLNRKGGEYACREYIDLQEENHHYTVMMLDLDNFKAINDTYGHDKGDYVLKSFAAGLKKRLERQDVISRIGGDEFFILMKDVSNINKVKEKAEAIIKNSNRIGKEMNIPLGCSIGIVIVREANLSFESLYKMSDELLYEAKKKGKNTYSISEYTKESAPFI